MLAVTIELSNFIRAVKSEVNLVQHGSDIYYIAIRNGIYICKQQDTGYSLPISPITIPQQVAEIFTAGYYDFKVSEDTVSVECYLSKDTDNTYPFVIFDIHNNTSYTDFNKYIVDTNTWDFLPNVLTKQVLDLFNIVSKVSDTTHKSIEFSNSMAYMSAENIKIVLINQVTTLPYSLNHENLWFLKLFNKYDYLFHSGESEISVKIETSPTIEYFMIRYRNVTGSPPNISRLALHTPLFSCSLRAKSLKGVLQSVKLDKHNPIMVRFTTSGELVVKNTISVARAHIAPPPINFSIDAVLLQKCLSAFSENITLEVYQNFFTLTSNDIIIIGGVVIG